MTSEKPQAPLEAVDPPGLGPASSPAAVQKASPLRAGIVSIAHHGVAQAIRVANHLILARLLSAQAFGLMGLVNASTAAVELFSDLGIGQKIVSSPRGTNPDFLNTAWTIKAARGLVIWFVTLLLAWPVARFYGERSLLYLIPVVGLGAILGGLISTSVSSAERRLSLDRVVALQIASQIVAAAVTITWAWLHPTVWALVAGGLASTAVFVVGSHTLLPGPRNRFLWKVDAATEIFHFGRWMLPGTVAYFFLALSHRLILGKFVTTEILGLFNIAVFLGGFVPDLLNSVSSRVLLPLYVREDRAGSNAAFMLRVARARGNLLLLALPPLCALVVWGPEVIALLYDARYLGAGWMTQVLAAGAVVSAITNTAAVLLLARGDSRRHFLSLAWGSALFVVFIVAGSLLGGWQGVVIALAAAPMARYPALAWGLHRQRAWQPLLDLTALLGASALIAFLWALKRMVT